MRVRIVSDLHVDVNETMEFGFMNETQDLLLIAGDVAGSAQKEIEFLSQLKSKTICIGGNHLGYDYLKYRRVNAVMGLDLPLDETKEDCIKTLTTHSFENVEYIENQYIDVGDYIVFGGTMYSDFLLYGEKQKDYCMNIAERWLNDFRYVHTFEKSKKLVRPVTANDYVKWNSKFMKELRKCLKNTKKDVIVLTHFAPSIKSIGKKYLNKPDYYSQPGSSLNAVYANDLEDFIKDNPRIKYWIHGHVHEGFDYNIEQCRVICSPMGYYMYEDVLPPQEYMGIEIGI